ncbi:MAG: Alpha-N-acetylgalactosaminidase [Lentisphaerae bacterium ADurb.Bin082]|nr:MAG: Alpha-N-acetylgalactosaminidase [Lentisphaerae bacterium ADurb.Bin082]
MSDYAPVKTALIGLGPRAETLLASIFNIPEEMEVVAVCDLVDAKIEKILSLFDKRGRKRPTAFHDYREMLKMPSIDVVLVATSWNSHLGIACNVMRAGKYVAIEVGGASSIDELWQLVHASESTGVSCMMLENCCYGRNELMVLNMVRQGLFGELIHCACGYEHDLLRMAKEYTEGIERAIHNRYRNCDLYPTHQLGPTAKILRINRGNRFLSLTSTASKARGLTNKAEELGIKDENGNRLVFNMGDVITTVIKCAGGETITATHGVTLPRPYSRDSRVQGTKGIWMEDTNGIYIEGISPSITKIDIAGNPYTVHQWTPVEDFYEKYDHPLWKRYKKNENEAHGGMDSLMLRALAEAVRTHTAPPIDVYDCAAWMSLTCLSEESIALGSMPVSFPDFTNGKWINRGKERPSRWSLNEVFDI